MNSFPEIDKISFNNCKAKRFWAKPLTTKVVKNFKSFVPPTAR
jgi:hypothetical protein